MIRIYYNSYTIWVVVDVRHNLRDFDRALRVAAPPNQHLGSTTTAVFINSDGDHHPFSNRTQIKASASFRTILPRLGR